MNRTVPLSKDAGPLRRPGQPEGDRLDDAVALAGAARGRVDHTAEMRAIAAQLQRLSGAVGHTGADQASVAPGRVDALRDAVAAIARRQADLDGDAPAPAELPAPTDAPTLAPPPEPGRAAPPPPTVAPSQPSPAAAREPSGLRRAGIDLSAEVSQTFARFSRDLRDAIHATDAGPKVEALGQEIRQIGRAVDGMGAALPNPDALARIGDQTREMRDLLKASTARSVPFDAVERQVASLEARLGRLAALPEPAAAAPPDLGATMAEVRALLDGFDPGATMAALETRLGAMTDRIERGLDAGGPSGLIEGLSRRVDEIHASLRSQLAASAVDTRPLEGLVRGLSERIGQAREATTDFHQLEAAVRAAAAKIDGAAAGLDPRGVQAVEAQLVRLSERLDRSEASLRALDGVEHTLGELFSQFEVTRQVAIDAAETAARTAARDTLRAALQNPNLAHRASDVPSAAVDQMARSLDDIRALQDTAERRTQSALSDIQIAMDRLAQRMAGIPARAPTFEEPRRPRAGAPEPAAAEAGRGPREPVDELIEPGLGRGFPPQTAKPEPRVEPEPEGSAPTPVVENDGPASFIAAARRAAQAAQASAAAIKSVERRPAPRPSASRDRAASAAAGSGTLGRARSFLAQRRRPILLSLAALVLLVGALEVVKLSAGSAEATRVSEAAAPARSGAAASATPAAAASKQAELPKAVLPAASAPGPAPLPTFVTGTKAPAPADGIAEGLRTAAASGDAGAQYEVGQRYSDGRGVSRDPKQAVAWFEKAAAQGSAPAAYRLGSAYEKGVGVDRDPALALGWYGKAADAGNIRAMHNLAVMSAEGAVGKPDYAKAAQWFGKASTYGVRDSQFNLAILYARGLGIEQSLPQSYTWFAIAASGGDEDAAKKRDEVAAKLDAKALSSAKAAADAFHAATAAPTANDVAPPAGGWDGAAPRVPAAAGPKLSQL